MMSRKELRENFSDEDFLEPSKELDENQITFTQENTAGFHILISISNDGFITHRSLILKPNNGLPDYVYEFDNKEDWEDFCEATWQTENYIAMKRTDFIEFYQALMFVHSYHRNTIEQSNKKLIESQREIKKQEEKYDSISKIVEKYREAYDESKV